MAFSASAGKRSVSERFRTKSDFKNGVYFFIIGKYFALELWCYVVSVAGDISCNVGVGVLNFSTWVTS